MKAVELFDGFLGFRGSINETRDVVLTLQNLFVAFCDREEPSRLHPGIGEEIWDAGFLGFDKGVEKLRSG